MLIIFIWPQQAVPKDQPAREKRLRVGEDDGGGGGTLSHLF